MFGLMKNRTTAQNYAKGLCFLFPIFNWKKSGVDTTEIDFGVGNCPMSP